MIVKGIESMDAVNYICKHQYYNIHPHNNFQLTDDPKKRMVKTGDFLAKHKEVLLDSYFLKGNERDVKGTFYKRFDTKKNWMGIFDNNTLRGINFYTTINRPLKVNPLSGESNESTVEIFDGLLIADSEDIAAELSKKLFIWTTAKKWVVNYSFCLENFSHFDINFYETIGYKSWASLYCKDKYDNNIEERLHFLKRLPEAFDD
tara:strand:+ start:320 stop:931 length:612 start_codon:yes stop_codon:yes gene_type:complete